MQKTNAMRILDQKKVLYSVTEYETCDGKIDGISVAIKVNKDPNKVFKTLVLINGNDLYVFVIPVNKELDLKAAAKAACIKYIEMLPQKQLLPLTGYIHGGCTAIGMKKRYPVFIDESVLDVDYITVSGGRVGVQITLSANDYIFATQAKIARFTKEN